MFQLKTYQENTLEVLQKFLEDARFDGAKDAFERIAIKPNSNYKPISTLEDVPYVCLRLPTGGGKTFLSAHSIGIASKSYLEKEFPVALWLTPTSTIKNQTVETLKNINHPNRKVLENAFGGNVLVFDIEDVDNIRPQDLTSKACIIVSTIQYFRVDDKKLRRKVYDPHEAYEPHFEKIINSIPNPDRDEKTGEVLKSFANLLKFYRPLVIVDEAHNANTKLSYDVMDRINPACIIEYTATPDLSNSNVLYRVSAMELKAEEMIKLPIILTEYQSWQEVLNASILMRKKLEDTAKNDKDYIRPIVLIQAENKDKEVTVEVIKNHLMDNENIPAEEIAIATGEQRELDGIKVLAPDCKIKYIITVQALKEGWDCPFAYIFCSVANVYSKKDVEQLLGRVLRMPYAKSREENDLNKAYAYVSSASWTNSVSLLHDRLVEMGFDETEAENFIEPTPQQKLDLGTPEPVKYSFKATKIDTSVFTEEEKQQLQLEQKEDGSAVMKIGFELNEELQEKVTKAISSPKDKEAFKNTVAVIKRQQINRSPAEKGEVINIPQLCLWEDGELEVVEKESLLPNGWNLLDYPAELTQGEFYIEEKGKSYEIDIDGKKITERFLQHSLAIELDEVESNWTNLDLSRWLDRQIQAIDITQPVKLEFIRRLIDNLNIKRQIPFTAITRTKFLLKKAIESKINYYRKQAFTKGFQQTLFENKTNVETSFNFSFEFGKYYPAGTKYTGSKKFNKHFFGPIIGDMNGEEADCALAIDSIEEVKYWVRNIEKYPNSFSLPTSSDKFYPDFVAVLNDGRILAIEYKGDHLLTNDDTKEKDNIGQLWEERSNGKCLFLMAVKQDLQGRKPYQQIKSKI